MKTQWFARDRDKTPVLFDEKPKRDEWYGFWCEGNGIPYNCNDEMTVASWKLHRKRCIDAFPEITWEDEPIEVEMKLVRVNRHE